MKVRKIKDCGPLHDLLLRACPPHARVRDADGKWGYVPDEKGGTKSIAILAMTLGMSAWGVQKWCKDNKIPPRRANQIVDNNPTEVSLADFGPFVYM